MKQVKTIAIFLVLAAYLIPASGVMVFLHHCNAMNTTEISLDGSNSCCNISHGTCMIPGKTDLAVLHGEGLIHQTFLEKQSCCKDEKLFVKLSLLHLSTFVKDLTPQVAVLEFDQELFSMLPEISDEIANIACDSPDPPIDEVILITSSFRL